MLFYFVVFAEAIASDSEAMLKRRCCEVILSKLHVRCALNRSQNAISANLNIHIRGSFNGEAL
jgi:hypothetical protein